MKELRKIIRKIISEEFGVSKDFTMEELDGLLRQDGIMLNHGENNKYSINCKDNNYQFEIYDEGYYLEFSITRFDDNGNVVNEDILKINKNSLEKVVKLIEKYKFMFL